MAASTSSPLIHFLIIYNHGDVGLVEAREFGTDMAAALAAYAEAESRNRSYPDMEIVLLASDSLDTVRSTHSNYFDGAFSKSPYLVGI